MSDPLNRYGPLFVMEAVILAVLILGGMMLIWHAA
jgi:hypothetical protein